MVEYPINRGVNRPIEFRGLKAQYIAYLAAGMLLSFSAFGIAYALNAPLFLCLIVALVLGTAVIALVFRLNARYGEHGLMKRTAWRRIPTHLSIRNRRVFTRLADTKT